MKLLLPYGRVRILTEDEQREWLEDVFDGVDEMLSQPLTVTHPTAFCAPEMIRERILFEVLKAKIETKDVTSHEET